MDISNMKSARIDIFEGENIRIYAIEIGMETLIRESQDKQEILKVAVKDGYNDIGVQTVRNGLKHLEYVNIVNVDGELKLFRKPDGVEVAA